MRKDDVALVVDGHDEEQRQQDGRNEYTAQGRADEVKAALDEAVPLAGQVILEGQHEDLFAEERLCLDVGHRCADEVWHEGDVPDMRLDLLDEVLQCLFLEARCRDDDILDAGVAHDGLCVLHLAVEQEFLRDALGDWMVVDDARHVVAVAEVVLEEAQHALGCPPGADQDDGLIEEVGFLQKKTHEIAREEDEAHDKDGKEYRVEARERYALLEQKEQDDAADHTVDDGAEDLAHRVEQGLHLGVDLAPCQEYKEDQRHPDVDVGTRDPVDDIPVPDPQCQFLGGDDGGVVGHHEDEWYKETCVFFCHLCTSQSIAVAADFAQQERTALFQPVLMLQERDVLLMVVDVVVLQPYIEQALTHEAEDARLIGIPAGDVDALLEFAENGKEPAAVGVKEIAAHDAHVEHVRPAAIHDGLEGRHIRRELLGYDLLGQVEAFGVMGMVVV